MEFPAFQNVSFASSPVSRHHREEPGSILFTPSMRYLCTWIKILPGAFPSPDCTAPAFGLSSRLMFKSVNHLRGPAFLPSGPNSSRLMAAVPLSRQKLSAEVLPPARAWRRWGSGRHRSDYGRPSLCHRPLQKRSPLPACDGTGLTRKPVPASPQDVRGKTCMGKQPYCLAAPGPSSEMGSAPAPAPAPHTNCRPRARGEALPLPAAPAMACTIPSACEGGGEEEKRQRSPSHLSDLLPPAPLSRLRGGVVLPARAGLRGARPPDGQQRAAPLPASPPPPPCPVRPRPGRHVAAAAGAAAGARAAAGAYGACTARSSVPRTRTLASGCSLHQVTQRGSEVGQALPQRLSLVPHPAPLTGPGGARPRRGGAGPSLGQETGAFL